MKLLLPLDFHSLTSQIQILCPWWIFLLPFLSPSTSIPRALALSRIWHEPFSSRGMVPPLSPHSGCPCWDYASLQPGTNPWGLSFAERVFFVARTGRGVWFFLGQISRWGPRVSCLEVARQIPQCLPWGLQPLGRKLPSFCFCFPSVKYIFGIGWFSNEMH